MKLAAVQYRPPKGQVSLARAALVDRVDEAGRAGARFIVCPEMATSGYVWESPEEILPHAEPAAGPTAAALGEVARRHEAWVVCGFPELAPDGLYNAALVIAPSGELLCCYRKILLYEADMPWSRAGWRRMSIRAPFGVFSPAICMDLNDPRLTWFLQRSAPDLVAFCTNWVDSGEDMLPYWRERLGSWRGWFVAADTWGEDRGVLFYGRSAILAPGGAVLAMGPAEGDDILYAEAKLPGDGG